MTEFREQASTQTRTTVINTDLTWNSLKSSLPRPSPFSILYILIHDSPIELLKLETSYQERQTDLHFTIKANLVGMGAWSTIMRKILSHVMAQGREWKVGDPRSEHGEGARGARGPRVY